MADTIPLAELDPQADWHPDADTAAMRAVASLGKSRGNERAGVLFKNPNGKFSYSSPVEQNRDNFSLRVKPDPGHAIAGIFHTHPSNDQASQVFSPGDIDMANRLKVPSYVLFEKDGSVRKYVPGKTQTRDVAVSGSFKTQKVADGDPVTAAPALPPAKTAATAPASPDDAATTAPTDSSTPPVVTGEELTGENMADPSNPTLPISNTNPTTASASTTPGTLSNAAAGSSDASLNSLYTQNPGTANATAGQAADPTAVTDQNATAATVDTGGTLAQAQQTTAAQNTVDPNQLASNQLNDITSQDSPLMEQAQSQANASSNSRGMLNSSLASGASEAAMVSAATPLAEQNAATEANSSLANQAATNTAANENATLGTQVSQTNSSNQTQIANLNAQMQTAVSQGNSQQANAIAEQLQQLQTQTDQFNASQTTSVNQSNTAATNAMTAQVLQANSAMNQQYLAGTQSMDLATIQGTYQNLIAQNSAAASLYNSFSNSIAATMANTNLDPARAAQIVQVQQNTLAAGLQLMDSMNNLYPPSGSTAPATGSTGTGGLLTTGANASNPSTAGGVAATSNSSAATTGLVGAGLTGLGAALGSQGATTAGTAATGLGGAANVAAGVEKGGVGGALTGAIGAGQVAGAVGSLSGNPLPSSVNSGVGMAGSALGVVGGLQAGGAAGDAQAAISGAQLATKAATVAGLGSSAAGNAAADTVDAVSGAGDAAAGEGAATAGSGALGVAGTALGAAGAGLALYNAVNSWQSGATGSDALNGASAGASVGATVGSIVPGLGTLVGGAVGAVIGGAVGAISSLGGSGKVDPETTDVNQLINYTSSNGNSGAAAAAVQNPYVMMAGLFDDKSSSLPMVQQFGRQGEQAFTNSMVTQINNAVANGTISKSTPAAQVYSQVVAPWINSMGKGWGDVGSTYSTVAQGLVQNMVNQYVGNTAQSNWKAVGGDSPFANLPAFGGPDTSPTYAPSTDAASAAAGNGMLAKAAVLAGATGKNATR